MYENNHKNVNIFFNKAIRYFKGNYDDLQDLSIVKNFKNKTSKNTIGYS